MGVEPSGVIVKSLMSRDYHRAQGVAAGYCYAQDVRTLFLVGGGARIQYSVFS